MSDPVFDEEGVRRLLRSRVKSAGGQSAFARETGIGRTHLNLILRGHKSAGIPRVLNELNLRMAYVHGNDRSKVLEVEDVVELLRAETQLAGGISAWSRNNHVSREIVSRALNGKLVAKSIIEALHLRTVFVFDEAWPKAAETKPL
jgi:DNA invertase Pin-like site-specific DNA recombinase